MTLTGFLLLLLIDGQQFPVIGSILGATLFVAVLNLVTYRRAPPMY